MKLLFDQNISFRVAMKLKNDLPDAANLKTLYLTNKSDLDLWHFAKQEGYTIVSFDADFYDLATLYGHPPKVIWLRIGNTSTDNLVRVLRNHADLIKAFITDKNYSEISCLEIQ